MTGIVGKVQTTWDVVIADTIFNIQDKGGKPVECNVKTVVDRPDNHDIVVEIRFNNVRKFL